jgi:two-component system cell cycle sensor histidine kinase/response regulator CckA
MKRPKQVSLSFDACLNALPDLVHVVDREFKIVFANEAFLKRAREAGSETDVLGTTPAETFPFLEKNILLEYREVLNSGRPLHTRVTFVFAQSEVHMEVRKVPIFSSGEVSYIMTLFKDVTVATGIEKASIDAEERYRTAIEHSNDGVAIVQGVEQVYVNARYAEMFGYGDPGELVGRPIDDVIHRDDRDRVVEMTLRRQKGEQVPSRYEFTAVRKDGGNFFVEASVASTTYRGKEVSLACLRDVSERKLRDQEKAAHEMQLAQMQRMEAVGKLAGGVAHDFNNILTTIIGYCNLLQMKMDKNDPLRSYTDHILGASQRATQLTQGLLAFSRKQIIELRPVNIVAVIKGSEKMLKRLLMEDIDLKITSEPQELTVMADVTQINQVLINAALNSRDAMEQGGIFSIEMKMTDIDGGFVEMHGFGRPGRYALISVSDTGVGMHETVKANVFEPFFTTKGLANASGLGLSSVYGIVKQHGGYITVESQPDLGTTLHIYLPLAKGAAEVSETIAGVQGGTETLLLAEDDAEVRRITKELLEQEGYQVVEAEDGEMAIKRFMEKWEAIDLMVLDVVMPKRNGKEVYDEVSRVRPDIKVLFASGYTADVVLQKGVQRGTFNYIAKPISPSELLRKVRELLDSK